MQAEKTYEWHHDQESISFLYIVTDLACMHLSIIIFVTLYMVYKVLHSDSLDIKCGLLNILNAIWYM